MSLSALREAPRAIQSKIQSKASLAGVAALFYLSGALETEARRGAVLGLVAMKEALEDPARLLFDI